jgi:hypothetical protein
MYELLSQSKRALEDNKSLAIKVNLAKALANNTFAKIH